MHARPPLPIQQDPRHTLPSLIAAALVFVGSRELKVARILLQKITELLHKMGKPRTVFGVSFPAIFNGIVAVKRRNVF